MKPHGFDPISLIFGIVLGGIAIATMVGGTSYDLEAWLLPASVLMLGIGLLAVSLRGVGRAGDDEPSADTED